MRSELHRIFGVDLTAVPGIRALTAHVLLSDIGPDLAPGWVIAGITLNRRRQLLVLQL